MSEKNDQAKPVGEDPEISDLTRLMDLQNQIGDRLAQIILKIRSSPGFEEAQARSPMASASMHLYGNNADDSSCMEIEQIPPKG